jgi:carbohydrate kinase (thermoresistant glucokinase family)
MVIVVTGVSGAGKTVVGSELAARLGWAFEDADDFHPEANVDKMRRGVPLTGEDRTPWIRALAEGVRRWSVDGRDVVLACSALRKSFRDALRGGVGDGGDIRFVYLKGGNEEIDRRVRRRAGHFMPASLLKSQFDTLEEPDSSEALVIDIGRPVGAMVDAILAGLRLDQCSSRRRG